VKIRIIQKKTRIVFCYLDRIGIFDRGVRGRACMGGGTKFVKHREPARLCTY